MPDPITTIVITTLVTGVTISICHEEIRAILQLTKTSFLNYLYFTTIIKKNNSPILSFALKKATYALINQNNVMLARDGLNSPIYEISNNVVYTIKYDQHVFRVVFFDEEIKIYKFWGYKEQFEYFLDGLCKKYCSPNDTTIIKYSWKGKWHSSIRPNRKIIPNKNMLCVIDNCKEDFINREQWYNDNGFSYRWGCLLEGPTGTKKSECVEFLAKTFNKTIHILSLNSKDMSDDDILHLVHNLPPNSILLIEEIDRQFNTRNGSVGNNVTDYGILTAIDAPPRMSKGSIVVLTTNNEEFSKNSQWNALFRDGRIDKIFTFVDKEA